MSWPHIILLCIMVVGVCFLVSFLATGGMEDDPESESKEQGPMPRNHGGFGSGPSRSGHK